MKALFFFILVGVTNFSFASDFKQEAQEFLKPIKKAFMGELKVGMRKGPYNAINSCHIKAPHLLENEKSDLYQFGRTSTKIRNPQNEPPKWAKPILAEYVDSTIKDPKAAKIYTVDDNKKVYVEPIYVKSLCLNCHGRVVKSVKSKLNKLYPKDEATGYKVGEFRGIFWVKQR